jgi:hypothetical protein
VVFAWRDRAEYRIPAAEVARIDRENRAARRLAPAQMRAAVEVPRRPSRFSNIGIEAGTALPLHCLSGGMQERERRIPRETICGTSDSSVIG